MGGIKVGIKSAERKSVKGKPGKPEDGGILVIGSGVSGISCAYWLLGQESLKVTIIDDKPETNIEIKMKIRSRTLYYRLL